ncbi:unnamed protein product [Lymnaea stagnalis]|uniref:Uncharacterized protein n=1 Tax=Lymnaea stagnalis TaxID=6523 RepID=A0AAV2H8X7_LYMST
MFQNQVLHLTHSIPRKMAMNIIGVKVFSGCLFFFLAIFFGWTPFWCLKRCVSDARGKRHRIPLVEYLHSMASGVLVATCLLSLLPESLETVREVLASRLNKLNNHQHTNNNNQTGTSSDNGIADQGVYPLAELLLAFGFLFIYMTDTVIKAWQTSSKRKILHSPDETVLYQRSDRGKNKQGDNSRAHRWMKPRFSVDESESPGAQDGRGEFLQLSTSLEEDRSSEHFETDLGDTDVMFSEEDHPLAQKDKIVIIGGSDQLRSMALVAALCIHGFFDGVMLGLQTSESVILSLLFALSLHKSFVAIGLSLTLLNNYNENTKSTRILLYVFLFAVVAPAGLAMSAAFVHTAFDSADKSGEASIIPGCLQAFAVGTFMYVTFTETTRRHGKRSVQSEVMGHVALLLGFAFMAGLRGAVGGE